MKTTTIIPMHIRALRSRMELKDLSLRDVSELAEVPYTTASAVLSGRIRSAEAVQKLRAAIIAAPTPVFQPA